MTPKQKESILNLRRDNRGYAAIAAVLGLTKDQVSSFCRRNNQMGQKAVSRNTEQSDNLFCRNCGERLVQPAHCKPIKFCSAVCRTEWWNSHRDAVNKKAIYAFICANCGQPFTAYGNAKRKYCTHACYIVARFGGGSRND